MRARVRPGRIDDIEPLLDVLTRAFSSDPFMEWAVGGAQDATRRLTGMFNPQLRGYLRMGGLDVAHVADVVVGGAMWAPPGRHLPFRAQMRMAFALASPVSRQWRRMRTGFALLGRAQPQMPVWYLDTIATDPKVRGIRAGTVLLEHRLEMADAQGLPVYLEASRETTVTFYERFGFQLRGPVKLPDGPEMWTMLRPAP